ncbi:hypothetical protein [Natronococcus jeotgali]|uniref:hypothetical protein n=1 Tax=Natronococcus jeotgali TaxID=413812 RepID=UPI001360B09A|nr:hypothetical protein [Natronococcus jeotgali]
MVLSNEQRALSSESAKEIGVWADESIEDDTRVDGWVAERAGLTPVGRAFPLE